MKLNPWIEFDLVRSSSISERSIEYAGHRTITCNIFFLGGGGGAFFPLSQVDTVGASCD